MNRLKNFFKLLVVRSYEFCHEDCALTKNRSESFEIFFLLVRYLLLDAKAKVDENPAQKMSEKNRSGKPQIV
jgi:hypothetical protein